MFRSRFSALLAGLLIASVPIGAQALQTGYFLEDYAYSFRINPALHPSFGFIGLPFMGSTSLTGRSNIGVSTLFYPMETGLATFMHPNVSSEEFLSKLNAGENGMDVNFCTNAFCFGRQHGNFYNTVDINLRVNGEGGLPYDLLKYLKNGAEDGVNYNFSGLGFLVNCYGEIAYGASYRFGPLTIGARIKGLIGVAEIQEDMGNMSVEMSGAQWHIHAEGELLAAFGKDSRVATKSSANGRTGEVINFKRTHYAVPYTPTGYGLAGDIGFNLELLDNSLCVSGSIVDFGGIRWHHNISGETPEKDWVYKGGSLSLRDENTMGDEIHNIVKELNAMFEFKKRDDSYDFSRLAMIANAGICYRMPFYRDFNVGALFTHKFNVFQPWSELRISANSRFEGKYSLAASYGINTFGSCFGAMAGITAFGVNIFAGIDGFVSTVTPQFIPVDNLNTSVSLGLNLTF